MLEQMVVQEPEGMEVVEGLSLSYLGTLGGLIGAVAPSLVDLHQKPLNLLGEAL